MLVELANEWQHFITNNGFEPQKRNNIKAIKPTHICLSGPGIKPWISATSV